MFLGLMLGCFAWLFVRPVVLKNAEQKAIKEATARCLASGRYEDRHWTKTHPPEKLDDNLQVVRTFSGVITAEDQCESEARRELQR